MLKTAIANALLGALAIFSKRARDYAFCPERAARIRMRHRESWWRYYQRAQETDSDTDNMIADWWAIQFEFHTPPNVAATRGDVMKWRNPPKE
jgi:hypothetical protein